MVGGVEAGGVEHEGVAVGGKVELLLEKAHGKSGLADDGTQSADAEFPVIGDWDGDCASDIGSLHDDVAATPTDFDESLGRQDTADSSSGEHPESRQL